MKTAMAVSLDFTLDCKQCSLCMSLWCQQASTRWRAKKVSRAQNLSNKNIPTFRLEKIVKTAMAVSLDFSLDCKRCSLCVPPWCQQTSTRWRAKKVSRAQNLSNKNIPTFRLEKLAKTTMTVGVDFALALDYKRCSLCVPLWCQQSSTMCQQTSRWRAKANRANAQMASK